MHHDTPGIDDRVNLLIYGVGQSGTTALTKMLFALGWSQGGPPGTVDEPCAEHVAIRECNRYALTHGRLPPEAKDILGRLEPPWAVNDSRFVRTLPLWQDMLQGARQPLPVLLWLIRSIEEVKAACTQGGDSVADEPGTEGASVEELWQLAVEHFDRWPGPKLHFYYDQLRDAAAFFRLADVPRKAPFAEERSHP